MIMKYNKFLIGYFRDFIYDTYPNNWPKERFIPSEINDNL
jgi:hypothetical protein